LAEERLQLKSQYDFEGENILSRWRGVFRFKGDFTVDEYFGGKTDFELREANFSFTPLEMLDIKAGARSLPGAQAITCLSTTFSQKIMFPFTPAGTMSTLRSHQTP
jgi:hypothetical protein